MIWVEVPYRNICEYPRTTTSPIKTEVSQWIKENCQKLGDDHARFQFAGPQIIMSDDNMPFKHSRVAFLTKEEAMMFKLVWGGV
jgi:hypothetical protein